MTEKRYGDHDFDEDGDYKAKRRKNKKKAGDPITPEDQKTKRTRAITASIRQLITLLGPGETFCTRDCLNFGPRNAVDQALFRMVRQGHLLRVGWGVFTVPNLTDDLPPMEVVIKKKNEAFGRKIFTHGEDALDKLFAPPAKLPSCIFATDGPSTRFHVYGVRIDLKHYAPRKLELGDTRVALLIRGIWERRDEIDFREVAENLKRSFGRAERREMRLLCRYMPFWLSDWLVHHGPLPFGQ